MIRFFNPETQAELEKYDGNSCAALAKCRPEPQVELEKYRVCVKR